MQEQTNNSYAIVISASKDLENILEAKFQAVGKGLHEKVSSAEAQLPELLMRRLRKIASIRNKLVHEKDYQLANAVEFEADYNWCKSQLDEIKISRGTIWLNRIRHRLFTNPDPDKIRFPFFFWLILSLLLPLVLTKSLLHGVYWQHALFTTLASLAIIIAILILSFAFRYLAQWLKISWVVFILTLVIILYAYFKLPFEFQDLEIAFSQLLTGVIQ